MSLDQKCKALLIAVLLFGGVSAWAAITGSDQVDISHPNNGSDGGFGFSGSETGIDIADMLVGVANSFYQGNAAALDLRSYYPGVYGEDSWRVTPNLTLNYGVRWEATPYWSDSKNRNPDLILGEQSLTFPGAPVGYVFPGDPGVPTHFANTRWDDFGPRFGLAYAPNISGGPLQ
jgi:outer membrane receptor protein involved in Fe transport